MSMLQLTVLNLNCKFILTQFLFFTPLFWERKNQHLLHFYLLNIYLILQQC